jgi:hypothetical protein
METTAKRMFLALVLEGTMMGLGLSACGAEGGASALSETEKAEDPWPEADTGTDTGAHADAVLVISDLVWMSADGIVWTGITDWVSGHPAQVFVTMTNVGTEMAVDYPGVRLDVDRKWVSGFAGEPLPDPLDTFWYGLGPGESTTAEFHLNLSSDAEPGSEITLTASVTGLGCDLIPDDFIPDDCPPPAPMEITKQVHDGSWWGDSVTTEPAE